MSGGPGTNRAAEAKVKFRQFIAGLSDTPSTAVLKAISYVVSEYGLTQVDPKDDTMSEEQHNMADDEFRKKTAGVRFAKVDEPTPFEVLFMYDRLVSTSGNDRPALRNIEYEGFEGLFKRYPMLPVLLAYVFEYRNEVTLRGLRRLWLFRKENTNNDGSPPPSEVSATMHSQSEEGKATVTAWEGPFHGPYVDVLADSIQEMKAAANGKIAGNILPIVQSSGTGKSRLVHELAGRLVTIPLNVLKISNTASVVYPRPDDGARDFLTESVGRYSHTLSKYQAFLVSLMEVASERIGHIPQPQARSPSQEPRSYSSIDTLARDWRDYLETADRSNRNDLCRTAVQRAKDLLNDSEWASESPSSEDSRKIKTSNAIDKLVRAIRGALSSDDVKRKFDGQVVKICLYADEVSDMAQVRTIEDRGDGDNSGRTLLSAFTSAWSNLGPHQPIFLILLSTQSRLSDLAAPHGRQKSNRSAALNAYHHAPWTELPFDVLMPRGSHFFTPGTKSLNEVSRIGFMVQFGRPLWRTRYEAAVKIDSPAVRNSIVRLAFVKLTGGYTPENFNAPPNSSARVAAVVTRVLFDFDVSREASRSAEMEMVESNMRMVYSVPTHREYMRSGTPSEPILAAAATYAWIAPELKLRPLEILAGLLENDLVEKGLRGELVARFLLLLAYDGAVMKTVAVKLEDDRHCIAVPVLDFLRALFAENVHDNILHCTPHAAAEDSSIGAPHKTLEEAFSNAYVRFNHFVRHRGHVTKDLIDVYVAMAAVVRGMAIQGRPNQKDFDIAIPVVMTGMDQPLHVGVMSYILIQVKDRINKETLPPIDAVKLGVFPPAANNTNPYITITMQLGITGKLHHSDSPPPSTSAARLPTSPSKASTKTDDRQTRARDVHPRYHINVEGCSSTVYGVVAQGEKDTYAQLLATRDIFDEHDRANSVDLIRRIKPEWRRGPACYDWINDQELNTICVDDGVGRERVTAGSVAT